LPEHSLKFGLFGLNKTTNYITQNIDCVQRALSLKKVKHCSQWCGQLSINLWCTRNKKQAAHSP